MTCKPACVKALALLAVLLMSVALCAQSFLDDIYNNDLDSLKVKVELLNPNFKDAPYLANYLQKSESYDRAMFEYLLSKGADPNKLDEYGYGPLYYALRNENFDAMQLLIAAKADVNASWKYDSMNVHIDEEFLFFNYFDAGKQEWVSKLDGTYVDDFYQIRPLTIALGKSNVEITKALLKAGADPLGIIYQIKNAKASTAKTTVYYINTVFDSIIGMFVTRGISEIPYCYFANALQVWKAVNNLPKNKQPVLDKKLTSNIFAYLALGNMQELKNELSKGNIDPVKLLKYAVFTENWDIVSLLLRLCNKEIDDAIGEDEENYNLLSWAVYWGYTGVARMLLEHGAQLNEQLDYFNSYGNRIKYYPLVRAVQLNNKDLVKLLLEYRANPDTGVPLAYASFNKDIRDMLISAGANLKAVFNYSWYSKNNTYYYLNVENVSLLFVAAAEGSVEAIQYWLDKGLDPNGYMAESSQPLVAAVESLCVEGVKLLLERGATPNIELSSNHAIYIRKMRDGSFKYKGKTLHDYVAWLVDNAETAAEKKKAKEILKLLDKAIGG